MATSANEMVQILESFLASNAGVKQITVDGQTIQFDRAQALLELDRWKRQAATEAGTRKLFRSFDLGSAF